MAKIITAASTKGGVGKSFLTVNLALLLHKRYPDKRICIVDLCENGSVATGLKLDALSFPPGTYSIDWLIDRVPLEDVVHTYAEDALYFIPSPDTLTEYEAYVSQMATKRRAKHLSKKLEELKERFDFILIDTHPSKINDLVNYPIDESDFVVIPAPVSKDEIIGAAKTIRMIEEANEEGLGIEYGVVFNRVHHLTPVQTRLEDARKFITREDVQSFNVIGSIRLSQKVDENGLKERFLIEDDNQYTSRLVQDLEDVLSFILKTIA